MNYLIDIKTKVGGTLCLARVTKFLRTGAAPGASESEWALHDIRGCRAPWLDVKLRAQDVELIELEIERSLS